MASGIDKAFGLIRTLPRVNLGNLRSLPHQRHKVSTRRAITMSR